jgi:hypothetical protein
MVVGTEYELLHLFTLGGHTFTFHHVTPVVDNESTLVFTYGAQSDDKWKTATFLKRSLVGYSYVEEE